MQLPLQTCRLNTFGNMTTYNYKRFVIVIPRTEFCIAPPDFLHIVKAKENAVNFMCKSLKVNALSIWPCT